MYAHDQEEMQQLVLVFLRTPRDDLGEIDAALARNDIALIPDLAHRIKSSAQIVGVLGMAQLCHDLKYFQVTNIDSKKASAGAAVV
jgi:HPt (histidine-containing phosphotransfer) domain-containing protein